MDDWWQVSFPNSSVLALRWQRRRPRWSRAWDTAWLFVEKLTSREKGNSPPTLLTRNTQLLHSDLQGQLLHKLKNDYSELCPDINCKTLSSVWNRGKQDGSAFWTFATNLMVHSGTHNHQWWLENSALCLPRSVIIMSSCPDLMLNAKTQI